MIPEPDSCILVTDVNPYLRSKTRQGLQVLVTVVPGSLPGFRRSGIHSHAHRHAKSRLWILCENALKLLIYLYINVLLRWVV